MLKAVVVTAVMIAGLSGCSSSTDSQPAASMSAAAVSATDIAFAQSMIPHHEQAVDMADLALAPQSDASPEVQQLAEQIKGAQDPEIAQMTGWLQAWGAPNTMPGGDHSGHDMGAMTMSGMMSAKQMKALESASGRKFDTLWLEMMTEHHIGAIEMAGQVKASSDNPEVTALADQIISAQEQEIARMAQLLAEGQ